jgi:hypothetical protein
MTFVEPKKWLSWLSLSEFWYNTSFNTSLQLTPFQALHGSPPVISKLSIPSPTDVGASEFLEAKQQMLDQLKQNLHKAQTRMKKYADLQRSERSFAVGDRVYLKMEAYRLAAFGFRGAIKLQSKDYGHFLITHRVGNRAYRLQLPPGVLIHPVFHVSQLKLHTGDKAVSSPDLPLVLPNSTIKTGPEMVLQVRQIPRNNEPVVEWLISFSSKTSRRTTRHGKTLTPSSMLSRTSSRLGASLDASTCDTLRTS